MRENEEGDVKHDDEGDFLHDVVHDFNATTVNVSLRHVLVLLVQKKATEAHQTVPHVKNYVVVLALLKIELFEVLNPQSLVEIPEVVVSEIPLVECEVQQRFVGFVDFPLQFQQSEMRRERSVGDF